MADPNTSSTDITGLVEPGFEAVRDAFARNFQEGHELGAAFCVHVEGRKVVDLCGGSFDGARHQDPTGPTPCSWCSRRRRGRRRSAPTSWRNVASSTSTRPWRRTGRSSRRRARSRCPFGTCSATKPACRPSTDGSPPKSSSPGRRSSRRSPSRLRSGRPEPRTGITPSRTATWWERWSVGSPAARSGPSSPRKWPARSDSSSSSGCPRSTRPRVSPIVGANFDGAGTGERRQRTMAAAAVAAVGLRLHAGRPVAQSGRRHPGPRLDEPAGLARRRNARRQRHHQRRLPVADVRRPHRPGGRRPRTSRC